MVAEAAQPQVDLAQPVEEQQSRLHHRVLELALDELERGEGAGLQQKTACGRFLQCPSTIIRMDRRAARLGAEDLFHDRQERLAPSPQRGGVARAELRERLGGALEVGPPAQRIAALEGERHVELRLDVPRATALEVELAVPRHLVERAVEERMDVVPVARPARILDRAEAAADAIAALQAEGLEPRPAQVGLEDEAVVPRPQE